MPVTHVHVKQASDRRRHHRCMVHFSTRTGYALEYVCHIPQGDCSLSRWKSILRKRTTALTSFTIGRLPCWRAKYCTQKGHHHWQPQSRKAHPTGLCTYILILLGHALYGLPTMPAQMAPMFFAMKAKQRYPKNQIQSPS